MGDKALLTVNQRGARLMAESAAFWSADL